MKMKNITTHAEHLDIEYGKRGTKRREEYEKGSREFRRQAILELEKGQKAKSKKRRLSSSSPRPSSRP